jgi:hypothetical protein
MASNARAIKRFGPKRPLPVVLLLLCCWGTSICYANAGDDAGAARANMTFGTNTGHGPVLTIPAGDCRDAAFVLAKVTRHIRDAERSALYIAEAEDEYDDALQDLIQGNSRQELNICAPRILTFSSNKTLKCSDHRQTRGSNEIS